MKYALREGFKHYEQGVKLNAGDVVEMDEARAAVLADRFALVGGPVAAPAPVVSAPGAAVTESDEDGTDLDRKWSTVVKAIGDLESAADVRALHAAEKADRNRDSVLAACVARLKELGEKL